MNKKLVSVFTLLILLTSCLQITIMIQPVRAAAISVPGDYDTLADAIGNATAGDVITLTDNIVINETIFTNVSIIINGDNYWINYTGFVADKLFDLGSSASAITFANISFGANGTLSSDLIIFDIPSGYDGLTINNCSIYGDVDDYTLPLYSAAVCTNITVLDSYFKNADDGNFLMTLGAPSALYISGNTIEDDASVGDPRGINLYVDGANVADNVTFTLNNWIGNNYNGFFMRCNVTNLTITNNTWALDNSSYSAITFNNTGQSPPINSVEDAYIAYNTFGTASTERLGYLIDCTAVMTNVTYVGNYYGDYNGTDTDGDGIGETSYQSADGSTYIDTAPLTSAKTLVVTPFTIVSASALTDGAWNDTTKVLTFNASAAMNITNTGGYGYPAGIAGGLASPASVIILNGLLRISAPAAANTPMTLTYLPASGINNMSIASEGSGVIYSIDWNSTSGILTINASGNVNVTFTDGYPAVNFVNTVNGSNMPYYLITTTSDFEYAFNISAINGTIDSAKPDLVWNTAAEYFDFNVTITPNDENSTIIEIPVPDCYMGLDIYEDVTTLKTGTANYTLSVPYACNNTDVPALDWMALAAANGTGKDGIYKRVQLISNQTAETALTIRIYYSTIPSIGIEMIDDYILFGNIVNSTSAHSINVTANPYRNPDPEWEMDIVNEYGGVYGRGLGVIYSSAGTFRFGGFTAGAWEANNNDPFSDLFVWKTSICEYNGTHQILNGDAYPRASVYDDGDSLKIGGGINAARSFKGLIANVSIIQTSSILIINASSFSGTSNTTVVDFSGEDNTGTAYGNVQYKVYTGSGFQATVVGAAYENNATQGTMNFTGLQDAEISIIVANFDLSPQYTAIGTNTTVANDPCLFYSSWTDDDNSLSGFILETNNTGTATNETWTAFSGAWANLTLTLNATGGYTISWRVFANDSANNWNVTDAQTLDTTDASDPTISDTGTNTTVAGAGITFYGKWTDETNLADGGYIFSTNNTGTWTNESYVAFSEATTEWANVTSMILNSTGGLPIGYRWFANDSADNWGDSGIKTLTTTDETDPVPSDYAHNTTIANDPVLFSCKWTDETGLGGYIFSWNSSGSWVNSSYVSFSTNPEWANVSQTLNATGGLVIGYRWFANDSSDNWVAGAIQSLTTIDDTVPYSASEGTNTTIANDPCLFYANILDETGLSGYIFSINQSGAWVNGSFTALSGLSDWANETATLNATGKLVIGYRWYFNDTTDNWNGSGIFSFTSIDDTVPTDSNMNANTTIAGAPCELSIFLEDETELDFYVFSTNNTGIWVNESWVDVSGLSTWGNVTLTLNSTGGLMLYYRWYANDTSNNWQSDQYAFSLTDATTPTSSGSGTNTTVANDPCLFYIELADETQLDYYIFSTNQTGTWVNDSAVDISGLTAWANVTKTLNATGLLPIGYRWYFNDTTNNWGDSGIKELTTTDDTKPTFTTIGSNTTIAGNPCLFYIAWADETNLSGYILESNNTGSVTNETWTAMTGLSNWSNATLTLNTNASFVIQWRIFANDSSNNWNVTGYQNITLTDEDVPTSASEGTNTTQPGDPILFYGNWTDNTILSGYIFSTNQTGAWVNETWTAFTGTWANVSKTLNSTGGLKIGYRWFANDSSDNWGDSGIKSFTSGSYTVTTGPFTLVSLYSITGTSYTSATQTLIFTGSTSINITCNLTVAGWTYFKLPITLSASSGNTLSFSMSSNVLNISGIGSSDTVTSGFHSGTFDWEVNATGCAVTSIIYDDMEGELTVAGGGIVIITTTSVGFPSGILYEVRVAGAKWTDWSMTAGVITINNVPCGSTIVANFQLDGEPDEQGPVITDPDRDGDGIPDATDPYPDDPTNTEPLPDRDGDGLPDAIDPYPDDPTNTVPVDPDSTWPPLPTLPTTGNPVVDMLIYLGIFWLIVLIVGAAIYEKFFKNKSGWNKGKIKNPFGDKWFKKGSNGGWKTKSPW